MEDLESLLREVRACTVYAGYLPYPPRPILRGAETARLLIVGQALGRRVHETGIPWNDPSGDRLRTWLQLSREQFYDESRIAIIPAAFSYPGRGAHGDLPPRPEIRLTLLVGSYAQAYYLGKQAGRTLAATVQSFRQYLPDFLPLPHPSPRNQRWFGDHPWFEAEVVPELRELVHDLLA